LAGDGTTVICARKSASRQLLPAGSSSSGLPAQIRHVRLRKPQLFLALGVMAPGRMQFTRMLSAPSSWQCACESHNRAFAVMYTGNPVDGIIQLIELKLMMDPRPAFFMAGITD